MTSTLLVFAAAVLLLASNAASFSFTRLPSSTILCTKRWSSTSETDDGANESTSSLNDERKVRVSYFLQTSGYQPSSSTDAIDSMVTLEESLRKSLLARVGQVQYPDQEDYIQELTNEWQSEWDFRQSAATAARSKASIKQKERLDAFLSSIQQRLDDWRGGKASQRRADERPGFGMPYGEKKVTKKVEEKKIEDAPLPPPVEEKTAQVDAPILGKIMEEKDEIEAVEEQSPSVPESTVLIQTEDEAAVAEVEVTEKEPADGDAEASTTESPKTDEEKAVDGVSADSSDLRGVSEGTSSEVPASPESIDANNDAELAEQRAAAARVAQEKADRRAQEKLDAANKQKNDAKARAEALLMKAEEEERQRKDNRAKEDAARKAADAEAGQLRLQEEEEDRKRAEEEELARAAEIEELRRQEEEAAEASAAAKQQKVDVVESKMQSLQEKATGVTFDAKLEDGLYLVGVGVRKKAIINIYGVAMYTSPAVLEAVSAFQRGKQKLDAQNALRNAARSFDSATPKTTFVLELVFKADAKTIAGAIADSVKPRYSGAASDVNELESLIFEGVKSKGGTAIKGTVFRFDCTESGVTVSVDGNEQGQVESEGIGSAFVDVFMDDKAVSPQLIDSCLDTWCESGL